MAVLNPLKVILTGRPSDVTKVTALDFPFNPNGTTHSVPVEDTIYIDRSDFRMEDSEDYYGLAPNKIVGLKYFNIIRCDHVEVDKSGDPTVLHCSVLVNESEKPKGAIQWVPATSGITVEVRYYNLLFTIEEPTDAGWESELNHHSEIVYSNAKVVPAILDKKLAIEDQFQFERLGFFTLDKDSVIDEKKLVFNLTVNMKDSKPKAVGPQNKSRKEEQERHLAEKMARMNINPIDMFKSETNLYSQFDEDGIPTHDANGEKISKSMYKKLKKDWEKQKLLYEKNKK